MTIIRLADLDENNKVRAELLPAGSGVTIEEVNQAVIDGRYGLAYVSEVENMIAAAVALLPTNDQVAYATSMAEGGYGIAQTAVSDASAASGIAQVALTAAGDAMNAANNGVATVQWNLDNLTTQFNQLLADFTAYVADHP